MRHFPLEATLTHDARGYAVTRVRGYFFSHVLTIYQDAKADVYGVEEATEGFTAVFYDKAAHEWREGSFIPPMCVSPRSFLLRKCGGSEEGLYLVTLSARPSCQCFGYNRWQGCKHIDAILDLDRRREI